MEIVSIIIPCRNEEKYILNCLNSVLNFKLPPNVHTEIIVVDGMSNDKTLEILNSLRLRYDKIKVLKNVEIFQSFAINIGIKASKGEFILRLDAHATYPENYLSLCYSTMKRVDADNVGGVVITNPGSEDLEGYLVQAMTTHKFGVGNSGFRVGADEGYTDTVPYGFFRRSLFEKFGFFNEKLVRAQDYEFNKRIVKNGGRIWINPQIRIEYFNQPTLAAFYGKQFFKEAPYNAYMWYVAPYAFSLRHAITVFFTLSIILGGIAAVNFTPIRYVFLIVASIYLISAIVASIQQGMRYNRAALIAILPVCFFLYHFLHGLGVLIGLAKLLFRQAPVQKNSVR